MNGIVFAKMHGLGNDFVVVDARMHAHAFTPEAVRRIADRRTGVGCDQFIVVEPSARADAFMRIHNADGGEAGACGNAARCVARILLAENGRSVTTIETRAGILRATPEGPGRFAVDMGPPGFDWQTIPLAEPRDTLHLGLSDGPLADPVAVSMANPHAVFFVDSVEEIPLAVLGPRLEHHALFPERANIGIAQILAPDRMRLRVWERGVGLTPACGSGACAAMAAGVARGLIGRRARLELDGGCLDLRWEEGGGVVMSGPATHVFEGILDPALLADPR